MNNHQYAIQIRKVILRYIFIFIVLILSHDASSQSVVALPHNGSSSQKLAPQGNLRFQRQFYLITPDELQRGDLVKDSIINSIGFTIAGAQNDTTKGNFKVYLQNTSDIHSRIDTIWTNVSTVSSSFDTAGLESGRYEWQVQTVCASGVSSFSNSLNFVTADTSICNIPANLSTDNISEVSASLHWTSPTSKDFSNYLVRYTIVGTANWDSIYTTGTDTTITGLSPNTLYQWRLRTLCSGEQSLETGDIFRTVNNNLCHSPSSLLVGTLTGTNAMLKWVAADSANYYEVEYRRKSTSSWIGSFAFTDSLNIGGLKSGTPYEWRVRTVCSGGKGAFIPGPMFSTTGAPTCYPPEDQKTNVQNATSIILSWASVPDAMSYNIRFRLKNKISWTNAIDPMTMVHCDSITIPDSSGVFRVPFSGGSGMVNYAGEGLYVAWEYSRALGPLSSFNTALATSANNNVKDKNGLDSITFVLSLSARSDFSATSHKDILQAVTQRPETWLGSTGLQDSVEVAAVYALGHHALSYMDTARISALIRNHSAQNKQYPVTLIVKDKVSGIVRYGPEMKNVSINGDSTALVSFNSWVPNIVETDSIIVFVLPQEGENALRNNRNFYIQKVNKSTVAYDDASIAITQAGFDNSTGLILSRFRMDGCGSVNATSIYLDFSAKNRKIYAVIMDQTGTIIDSSDMFTPDSTEVSRYHTFYFPKTPFFNGSDYYIGLAQPAGAGMGYNPVGVQWETVDIRDSAYYRANIDGSNLVNHPFAGRLMIRAELVPGRSIPVITGNSMIAGNFSLCTGQTDTLFVGNKTVRYASKLGNLSSQFSNLPFGGIQVLGAPDVDPNDNFSSNQWVGSTADGQREFIDLEFSQPDKINYIDIFETLNVGAVDSVFVKESGGAFINVYSKVLSKATGGTSARINHITFDTTSIDVSIVRITMASDSITGFNGIDAVGIGLESASSSFVEYKWSNAATTQFIEISAAGTYSVTVTDGNGCQSTDSVLVVTPSQVAPMISIAGSTKKDTAFCFGSSVTLRSDKSFGNIWSTGETTDSIVVDTSGRYYFTFDDQTGCGLQTSDTIDVIVYSLPTPTIPGPLGICTGGTITLDAGAGFVNYLWSNDSTTQSINVDTIVSLSVTVTDNNGCVNTSPLFSTFVDDPPSPNISGDLSFCSGDSTLLDAGSHSAYLWSTGETTQTIYVDTTSIYSVIVTEAGGCIDSTDVTTSFHPTPIPAISGVLGFCPGGSTVLTAGDGFLDYLWSTGSTNQVIPVDSVGLYTVTVKDNNGCIGDNSKNIVEYLPPEPIILGALGLCGGSSVQIMASGQSLTSYLWNTGQTSSAIFVDTADTYFVTVTDINGCIGDTSAIVTETGAIPMTPDSISGPTFMSGDSVLIQYSIEPVMNASYYYWTVPDGLTIVGRDDSTVVTVALNSVTKGSISVAAANGCGLSPSATARTIFFQTPSYGDCNPIDYTMDSNPIPSGIHHGANINSAGSVPENGFVLFRPESSVNLNVNFNVSLGAVFEVQLNRCDE